MAILLAWHAAYPEHVVLNRGNHEDHAICCVYGFVELLLLIELLFGLMMFCGDKMRVD